MTQGDIEIRRLVVDDAPAYRDIRLEGLRNSPEAFGSTFEREAAEPLSWFADRISNVPVVGAFRARPPAPNNGGAGSPPAPNHGGAGSPPAPNHGGAGDYGHSSLEARELTPGPFLKGREEELSAGLRSAESEELLGVAGFIYHQGKRSHIGMLWGMYVREAARRQGVGRRLVEAVIEIARERVEILELTVVAENAAARRLYESVGFEAYGLEKKALKQGDRYFDEVLMAKDLITLRTE